ncbi:hypothetical protein GCM10028812_53020 [Ancylobacter sonchi]
MKLAPMARPRVKMLEAIAAVLPVRPIEATRIAEIGSAEAGETKKAAKMAAGTTNLIDFP